MSLGAYLGKGVSIGGRWDLKIVQQKPRYNEAFGTTWNGRGGVIAYWRLKRSGHILKVG